MKQNKYLAPVLYLLLATVVVILGICWVQRPLERLSEEQIAALREEYPVYTEFCPPMVDMRIPSLDELISRYDSFVYAECIGEAERHVRWGWIAGQDLREFYHYPSVSLPIRRDTTSREKR